MEAEEQRVRVLRLGMLVGAVWAGSGLAGPEDNVTDLRADEAIELYDQGRYAEARKLLQELDAEGKATGALLYRLSFCHREASDTVAEMETLRRAIEALQHDLPSAKDLEVPFYLSNAYRNARRLSDSSQVASAATARVERGELPQPVDPVEMFRLAKLYADQRREGPALNWYRKSVEALAGQEARFPAYVSWARRYIGDVAHARADFATAEKEYAAVVALPQVTATDFDRLAVARVRLAQWDGASDAWQAAVRLDPANADRPRYCAQLAKRAAELGALPPSDPSGRSWNQLSRDELESLMSQQADVVRQALASVQAGEVSEEGPRQALQARVLEAKPFFVRAAIEYAVRNLPIQETAFIGGYAPLIFHANRWELPPPPPAEAAHTP
jgi:tetratricopeptide (TPR) repeat protein